MRAINIIAFAIVALAAAVVSTSSSYALVIYDNFDTDTTGNYQTYYWPISGSWGGTVNLSYDSADQKAILCAHGGYGLALMRPMNINPLLAGQNFSFGAYVSTQSEYQSALYIGDLQGPTGTYIECMLDSFPGNGCEGHAFTVRAFQNGNELFCWFTDQSTGNTGNLMVERTGSEYSFFLNDILKYTISIPQLDDVPLYCGVDNHITSGPTGWTSQTSVDNWYFSTVPEPGTVALIAPALLGLAGIAFRKMRKA